jgi:hypothetical protein
VNFDGGEGGFILGVSDGEVVHSRVDGYCVRVERTDFWDERLEGWKPRLQATLFCSGQLSSSIASVNGISRSPMASVLPWSDRHYCSCRFFGDRPCFPPLVCFNDSRGRLSLNIFL